MHDCSSELRDCFCCSQGSILSVGTAGGSRAGTGQGKKSPVDTVNGMGSSLPQVPVWDAWKVLALVNYS